MKKFSPNHQLMAKGTEQITTRLLQDVGASPERWEKLLGRISNLAPDRKGRDPKGLQASSRN